MTVLTRILKKPITSAVIAILVGFCVAAVILVAAGFNPAAAFAALFRGALGRPNYISNVIIKATPLLLCGIGISFAYKAGLFNIGAEGQYILGSVLAMMVGSQLDFPAPIQVPLVVLAGVVGGALIAGFVGWLKARFGIHEVITSIMCNWIALYFCNFIVNTETFHRANSTGSIMVNPSSYTMVLPEWKTSPEGLSTISQIPGLKDFLVRTDVNFGIVIAVVAAFFIGWLLTRTKVGYQIRAVGLNRDAAQFAGISVEKNIVLCMVISGALCGLAGALAVTGTQPHAISTLAAFENNGFNGLSVAFIAGCSPVGCIPASLLFAGLISGGQTVQQTLGAPSEIIDIMIGTIVFFMALGGIIPALADRIERKRALAAGDVQVAMATSATAAAVDDAAPVEGAVDAPAPEGGEAVPDTGGGAPADPPGSAGDCEDAASDGKEVDDAR